jgi:hypothetical protein
MKGVSYITDDKNQKTAVVIEIKTLKNYNEDLEDLLGGLIADSRKDEEKVPLANVIKNLKKAGKLK